MCFSSDPAAERWKCADVTKERNLFFFFPFVFKQSCESQASLEFSYVAKDDLELPFCFLCETRSHWVSLTGLKLSPGTLSFLPSPALGEQACTATLGFLCGLHTHTTYRAAYPALMLCFLID